MDITLERAVIELLSHRGILAYLAVTMADGTTVTTAILAGLVKARTESMKEGVEELIRATGGSLVRRNKNKWICGAQLLPEEVQILDSSRFQRFVDDLKKYWEFLVPETPFAMGGRDGQTIQRFLKDHPGWDQEQWRQALNNRGKSVVRFNAASRTEPFYAWINKLGSYLGGPLDRYGHPVEQGGNSDKHQRAVAVEDGNRAVIARAIASFKG